VVGLICTILILVGLQCALRLAFDAPTEGFRSEGEDNGDDRVWLRPGIDRRARTGTQCTLLDSKQDDKLPNVTIDIVDESCEDGLPHTVGPNRIRMTQSVWNGDSREQILAHERIHLFQKRNQAAWRQFYTEKWGYTHFEREAPPDAPEGTADTVRSNPDTSDSAWVCWQNRFWFVPVYRNPANPKIKETETRVWDNRLKAWTSLPPEWRAFFCEDHRCPNQLEHPHEISAEIASDPQSWKTPASLYLSEFLTSQKVESLPGR